MKKFFIIFLGVVFILTLYACVSIESSTSEEEAVISDTLISESVESVPEYVVEITGSELVKDYENKDALLVYMSWTNNSDKTTSFMVATITEAFQDGIELESAYIFDSDNVIYEQCSANAMLDIRPGATINVVEQFLLRSTSDVEIEVSELISFNDELLASTVITLP